MFEQVSKVAALMRGFKFEWCVAGGWAIDLFLERETRPHDDIEIAIFRRDQISMQKHLDGWLLRKAENYQLSSWKKGEFLELPIHEIRCFDKTSESSQLEVLLNETDGENWVFRRNRSVTKPLSEFYLTSKSGVKFLCPEIVLLYKSKSPRPKDEQDFQKTVSHLNSASKEWLKNAFLICYAEHRWLVDL